MPKAKRHVRRAVIDPGSRSLFEPNREPARRKHRTYDAPLVRQRPGIAA
jgi:hypothetical protein